MLPDYNKIDKKLKIRKYNQIPQEDIMEEKIEEDVIEIESEVNRMILYQISSIDFHKHNDSISKQAQKYNVNKDKFENILSSNKEQNNIFIAKDKRRYTKYGKLIDKLPDK